MTSVRNNNKLLYRVNNGEIKHKENITRLKEKKEVYEDQKVMSEVQVEPPKSEIL